MMGGVKVSWTPEDPGTVDIDGQTLACTFVCGSCILHPELGQLWIRLPLENGCALDLFVYPDGGGHLALVCPVPNQPAESAFGCEIVDGTIRPVMLGEDPEQAVFRQLKCWWTDVETVDEVTGLVARWGRLPLKPPTGFAAQPATL